MQNVSTRTLRISVVALGAYAVMVGLYFSPCILPYKLTWPVALLAVSGLWLLPRELTAAFVLCALGDQMGQWHSFPGQMGFFAAGHVFFLVYFVRHAPERAVRRTGRVAGGVAVGVGAWALLTIVPCVDGVGLRAGVTAYLVLILLMMWKACGQGSLLFAAGGLLFVVSDSVLAYNRFVSGVPHAGLYIMATYYAAQGLLFAGGVRAAIGGRN